MSAAFAIAEAVFGLIGFLGSLFTAALVCEVWADGRAARKREAELDALEQQWAMSEDTPDG